MSLQWTPYPAPTPSATGSRTAPRLHDTATPRYWYMGTIAANATSTVRRWSAEYPYEELTPFVITNTRNEAYDTLAYSFLPNGDVVAKVSGSSGSARFYVFAQDGTLRAQSSLVSQSFLAVSCPIELNGEFYTAVTGRLGGGIVYRYNPISGSLVALTGTLSSNTNNGMSLIADVMSNPTTPSFIRVREETSDSGADGCHVVRWTITSPTTVTSTTLLTRTRAALATEFGALFPGWSQITYPEGTVSVHLGKSVTYLRLQSSTENTCGVVCYDFSGNVVWSRLLVKASGGHGAYLVSRSYIDHDSDLYVVCSSASASSTDEETWLLDADTGAVVNQVLPLNDTGSHGFDNYCLHVKNGHLVRWGARNSVYTFAYADTQVFEEPVYDPDGLLSDPRYNERLRSGPTSRVLNQHFSRIKAVLSTLADNGGLEEVDHLALDLNGSAFLNMSAMDGPTSLNRRL